MGAYQSTTGIKENSFKLEISLKKRDNIVKYIILDHTQMAKKEITNPAGNVMTFDVDLVTRQISYHGMSCGQDGDFDSLQEAILAMNKEIRECVSIETKPSNPDEMDE